MSDTGGRSDLAEWGRTLLWLELLLVAVLFSTRTTESFELPKIALLRAAALALLGGALACGVKARWPRDPFALAMQLSLLVAAACTVLSISPRTSLLGAQGSFGGLLTLASYAMLFLAARSLCSAATQARGVLAGAALGAGLTVAYGFVQWAGFDPLRWQAPVVFERIPRVFSTQGHPNALAQLLAMAWPVTAYLALDAWRRRARVAALGSAAACLAMLALLPSTLSRAGLLSVGVAVLVTALGWTHLRIGRRWPLVTLGSAALLLATIVLGSADTWEALRHRLLAGGALEDRSFLWTAALGMLGEHPWLGVGPECFGLAYGQHRTAQAWSAEWGETPLSAHSVPLDLLATRGLLGLLAALPALAGLLVAARRLRHAEDGALHVAALAGLLAFAVHSLFHFPTAAGASLAAVLAGLLSAPGGPLVLQPASHGRAWLLAAATVAAVHALVLRPLQADVLGQAGTVLAVHDPQRAVLRAREAVRLDPTRAVLWLRLSAAAQAAARLANAPGRAPLQREARRAAEEAVRLVPVDAYAWAHLGTLFSDLAGAEGALATRADANAAFERALALDPRNADILMAAGSAALAAGDPQRARSLASRCSAFYPRYAPPRALLGAALLLRSRDTGKADREQAARLLREALLGNWRGDEAGRAAAQANLRVAEAEP